MLKKLKQRIDQYLSVNWLRPETLLWDVPLSLLVDPYLRQKGKKLQKTHIWGQEQEKGKGKIPANTNASSIQYNTLLSR